MWQLGSVWHDEAALAAAWRRAEPFPHLVIDDFVPAESLPALLAILDEEPVDRYEADLYVFDATAPEPKTGEMRELRATFAQTLSPVLTRITGASVSRVDLRAYAYRVGHFLLPHADHQDGLERRLAFAYYLPSPEPPIGGDLELYACRVDRHFATLRVVARSGVAGPFESFAIVATESAKLIEPRANRLVVFDVSDVSLHQVREVLAGLRISLSGWFYP